jgi:uncharacterized repeat protein (TIGR03803 family)
MPSKKPLVVFFASFTFVLGFCVLFASAFVINCWAAGPATEDVIYTFTGGEDGAYPLANLISDSSGNLYSVAFEGGTFGVGTVYEVTPQGRTWNETVLHTFSGGDDGAFPQSTLIFDAHGNLYGTTPSGGSADCGVVFELSPTAGSWRQTVLYSFTCGPDGGGPSGGVQFDDSGNLYGTTGIAGDLSRCDGFGCGTVFRLSPQNGGWQESTLYSFQGGNDGQDPSCGVILRGPTTLYGATFFGGSKADAGTIFRLKLQNGAWRESVLYRFTRGNDEGLPQCLAADKSGNLFGTTQGIGPGCNNFKGKPCGTVFELRPSRSGWKQSTLYHFTGGKDGGLPSQAPLAISDGEGKLLGTTLGGGTGSCNTDLNGCGTVFALAHTASGWKETVKYSFVGHRAGSQPEGGVILDSKGNIYGTTYYGGNDGCIGNAGCGVVYRLRP